MIEDQTPIGDQIADALEKDRLAFLQGGERKYACTNCYSPTICVCLQDCPACGAVNFDRDPDWRCDCPTAPSTDQEP